MQVTKRKESKAKQQNNQIKFYYLKRLLECRKKVIEKKGSKEFSVPFIASEYTVKQEKNALALIRVTIELEYKSDLLSTLLYTINQLDYHRNKAIEPFELEIFRLFLSFETIFLRQKSH